MRLRKQQRLTLIAVALVLLGGAAGLVLYALSDSVAFFVTPSEIATNQIERDRRFRLGGLVVPGSVAHDNGTVHFALTDQVHAVPVRYRGLLPDLFREGQGIVAQGVLASDGVFEASEVLAKHDEAYMPPEVAEALKQAGVWQHGAPPTDEVEDGAAAQEAAGDR
jgi:cytochrome c-type biogenesis protein CcmE